MPMVQAQIWKSSSFTIVRKKGKAPGTAILHLSGPFTARDMYASLSPIALRNTFEPVSSNEQPTMNIFDLTDVPYMDSVGLGMIVSHYVRCKGKGIRVIVAGASPRVLELFKMTKVETFLPMTATVDEADID